MYNLLIQLPKYPGGHASVRSERRISPRRHAQRGGERAALRHARAAAPRRVSRVLAP